MPTVKLMSLCSVVEPIDLSFQHSVCFRQKPFPGFISNIRDETYEHNCLLSSHKNYSHNPKVLYDSPSFFCTLWSSLRSVWYYISVHILISYFFIAYFTIRSHSATYAWFFQEVLLFYGMSVIIRPAISCSILARN